MYKLLIRMGAVSLIAFFAASCATGTGMYQGYMMKGSVIAATQNGGVISIGTKDGAAVGQVLKTYRAMSLNVGKTTAYTRSEVGSIKITEVLDENFSRVSLVSGKIEPGYIVEHK